MSTLPPSVLEALYAAEEAFSVRCGHPIVKVTLHKDAYEEARAEMIQRCSIDNECLRPNGHRYFTMGTLLVEEW